MALHRAILITAHLPTGRRSAFHHHHAIPDDKSQGYFQRNNAAETKEKQNSEGGNVDDTTHQRNEMGICRAEDAREAVGLFDFMKVFGVEDGRIS